MAVGDFVRYNNLIYEVIGSGGGNLTLQPIRKKTVALVKTITSSQKQMFAVPSGGADLTVDETLVEGVSKGTATVQAIPEGYFHVYLGAEGGILLEEVVELGDKVTEPPDPVREHYTFDAWYTEIGFINPWDFAVGVVDDDITLYGKWIPVDYTVSYDSNDGSAVADETVTYGDKATEPAEPTLASYIFDAWYFDDETFLAPVPFATWVPDENTTLYAKWLDAVIVTFDSNEGSAVTAQTILTGTEATEPADPTLAEFVFAGWFYDDNTFVEAVDFENDTFDADDTLYAKWTGA